MSKKNAKKVTKKTVKKPAKKVVKKAAAKKSVKKVSKSPAKKIVKSKASGKPIDKKLFTIIGVIVAIVVVAILVVFVSTRERKTTVVPVSSVQELVDTLKVRIKTPMDTKKVSYGIENDNIARIEYSKEVSDGYTMDFVLKSSSATEDLVEYNNDFGSIAILMTVMCDDGSDIEVTSYVATDVQTIMKSEWYDNDLYYAMTTENLTTREDFLQEVNRVIIDNHVEF